MTEIRQGDRRDAMLFSFGVNQTHGQPRTNADKKCVVVAMLADAEWAKWSNRKIAKQCAVHNSFVSRLRPEVSVDK